MSDEDDGMTPDDIPFGGNGQGQPLKPYHRPVLQVYGRLRELTQGAASGNGDGASFGKKPRH